MSALSSIRRVALAMWLILPLAMTAGSAHAQSAGETQLKVALIYNFILFTEWPANAFSEKNELTICAARDSGLLVGLLTLERKSIRNHRLHVVALSEPVDYQPCEVLFIDVADRARLPKIRQKLDRKSTLTILDGEDVNNDGAAIAMTAVGDLMVFDVNATVAQSAQLSISSKLLRLARRVH